MGGRVAIGFITLLGGLAAFVACLRGGAPALVAAFLSIFGFAFTYAALTIVKTIFRPVNPPPPDDHSTVRILRGGDLKQEINSTESEVPTQVRIGGIYIDPADEPKHFLFSGATGSGKTQGINKILKAARSRGARVMLADAGGSALQRFYDPNDIIFNPFDTRSVDWSPFADIHSDYDCQRIAKAAIPNAEGDAQEWHVYAQTLLGETLRAMHNKKINSVRFLMEYLTEREPQALLKLVEGTAAEMLCKEGAEKMLASTRAIVSVYLMAWRFLPDTGTFSVRNWIRNEKAANWLFVTYREDQFEFLRYLIATMLDLAIVEALSLTEDDSRELWFVMDEVDSLGKISSLRQALSKLRKYGGRCVLGLQTIAQLRSTYGQNEAQTLLANVATKVVLRAGDGETADYFSKEFGSHIIERTQVSSSTGFSSAGGQRSTTLNEVQETRRVVLDSEIAGLKDLEAFLKTTGALQKVKLTYESGKARTDAFIART